MTKRTGLAECGEFSGFISHFLVYITCTLCLCNANLKHAMLACSSQYVCHLHCMPHVTDIITEIILDKLLKLGMSTSIALFSFESIHFTCLFLVLLNRFVFL